MFVYTYVSFWWDPNGTLQRISINQPRVITGGVADFYWVPGRHFYQRYFYLIQYLHINPAIINFKTLQKWYQINHLGTKLKCTKMKDKIDMVHRLPNRNVNFKTQLFIYHFLSSITLFLNFTFHQKKTRNILKDTREYRKTHVWFSWRTWRQNLPYIISFPKPSVVSTITLPHIF